MISSIVDGVRNHRLYHHPIFHDWVTAAPTPEVVGALFHQIQMFCASTRPGHAFPEALSSIGLARECHLMQEIVDSEENHGPELATMAGYIMNAAAQKWLVPNVYDTPAVEAQLKRYSDVYLGRLPGYDIETGLTAQCRRAIQVFERRKLTDRASTFKNLGTALALEIISNRHLIPGEKYCLIDSGLYGATWDDPEMHYLLEHWGEVGAEQQHELNATAAVASVLDARSWPLIAEGADDFLDSLASLWDLLDASLLASGCRSAA